MKQAFNPQGLPVPRGSYSQVVIPEPGRLVFIAGQTATDPERNVVGVGDVRVQTRCVLEKLKVAVEAAGGTLDDIVSMTVFLTDIRYNRDVNETRREVFKTNGPASTMVQVVALARPELLLEVNAMAVVPGSR